MNAKITDKLVAQRDVFGDTLVELIDKDDRVYVLDGDLASNHLSWQWVASSFSHKPYLFNRANLERFSSGRSCDGCRLASRGCPFEASYEQLDARLFDLPATPRRR